MKVGMGRRMRGCAKLNAGVAAAIVLGRGWHE